MPERERERARDFIESRYRAAAMVKEPRVSYVSRGKRRCEIYIYEARASYMRNRNVV